MASRRRRSRRPSARLGGAARPRTRVPDVAPLIGGGRAGGAEEVPRELRGAGGGAAPGGPPRRMEEPAMEPETLEARISECPDRNRNRGHEAGPCPAEAGYAAPPPHAPPRPRPGGAAPPESAPSTRGAGGGGPGRRASGRRPPSRSPPRAETPGGPPGPASASALSSLGPDGLWVGRGYSRAPEGG